MANVDLVTANELKAEMVDFKISAGSLKCKHT